MHKKKENMNANKKGKFIVIEGTDGSGKATQVELLKKYYSDQGEDVFVVDFPQYDKPSSYFVQKYLRGEYGTADEVGAYRGSIFYALDRYDASFEIKQKIVNGCTVIANRYVSANMGHQAGKIDDLKSRDEYLNWLDNLEFNIFNIPRPDITIFLYVPPEIGQKLVDQKNTREYTGGKKRDIHEADLEHLKRASEAYFYVSKKYNWSVIDCTIGGEIISIEEVSKKIIQVLNDSY